ncbi:MAG TPA: hypothetical protein PKZ53_21135, partial [Acidobacteriota bacterium]|nr:hypothetical protein [Acidobacteriota bacterium]
MNIRLPRPKHWLWAVVLILLGCVSPLQAQEKLPAQTWNDPQLKPSDPLTPMNNAFRVAYAGLRTRLLAETSPVIVHAGDKLILFRNGVQTDVATFTPRYHELKSVAHVPLALYVMLVHDAGSKLTAEQLTQLRDYRALVVAGRDSIAGRNFASEQQTRQYRLLDQALALIDAILKDGMISRNALRQYTKSQAQDVLANAYDAADDQLATMDAQVKAWLAQMTPEERKRVKIAVGSAHMPRLGNLAMQYFSATFNEPYEGKFEIEEEENSDFRVIYAESLF